jgi:transketolase
VCLRSYFRFGVREHAMIAACNGMFAYGALIPFGATFLNFMGALRARGRRE